ncbi:ABC transporter permease [Halolamina salina]
MRGSVLRIARHDFLNVRRSRLLWGVVVAYALFTVLLVVSGATSEITSATQLLVGVTGVTAVVLPVVGIVAGYLAIAGEREDGTITYRLGLPDSRLAVVAGKLLSRGVTVVLGLGAGFAVALGLAIATFGSVDPGVFARFVAISTVFALANAAVAVGLSAVAASRARAMSLAAGFYVVGDVLWLVGSGYVVDAVEAVGGVVGLTVSARDAALVTALSPVGAYLEAMELAFAPGGAARAADAVPWFGLEMLLLWGVAVPTIGYWRFRTAELG